jgi:phage tail protein X
MGKIFDVTDVSFLEACRARGGWVMQNDAKLGLVVGVVVVITIAVVFFRKDSAVSAPFSGEAAAAAVGAPKSIPSVPVHALNRPVEGKTVAATTETSAAAGKHHIVREGETLFSLAEQYYGDKSRFITIYQANRGALQTPDTLTAGTDLLIPELSSEQGTTDRTRETKEGQGDQEK